MIGNAACRPSAATSLNPSFIVLTNHCFAFLPNSLPSISTLERALNKSSLRASGPTFFTACSRASRPLAVTNPFVIVSNGIFSVAHSTIPLNRPDMSDSAPEAPAWSASYIALPTALAVCTPNHVFATAAPAAGEAKIDVSIDAPTPKASAVISARNPDVGFMFLLNSSEARIASLPGLAYFLPSLSRYPLT